MPSKSDKLFQKRKSRVAQKRALQRRAHFLQPRKRILIVCEGDHTERIYLERLIQKYSLTSVEVEICTDCGSAPISVVEHAESRVLAEGGAMQAGYDSLYCVFDRDEHETYFPAIAKIDGLKRSRNFPLNEVHALVSWPCIEFWFFLHFQFSRAPIVRAAGRSPGENAVSSLKTIKEFAGYEKRMSRKHADNLIALTDQAVKNSKRALDDAKKTGELNPHSTMHELVQEFERLKVAQE